MLSATVALLRAVFTGDTRTMQRMQYVYPRLRDVPAVPDAMVHPGFAAIEDHAMELSQRAVSDRLE
eukprot:8340922-Pyramimonas_sp.AAC.1